MSSSWDKLRTAKEEEYFSKKNTEALERMKGTTPRKSPITGEEMVQEVIHGVVIDRCKTSGGVWLDAGELELILEHAKGTQEPGMVESFVNALLGK